MKQLLRWETCHTLQYAASRGLAFWRLARVEKARAGTGDASAGKAERRRGKHRWGIIAASVSSRLVSEV